MVKWRGMSALLLGMVLVLSIGLVDLNQHSSSSALQLPLKADVDNENAAVSLTELQKQVVALRAELNDLKRFRIVAAGTGVLRFGPQQDNQNCIRIKLPAEIVKQLGNGCIVQLTNRYPPTFDFFVPYWRQANDGFDIFLADPSLVGVGLNTDRNSQYLIDWTVVQK